MTNYSLKPRDWIMDYGSSYGFVVMSYAAKDQSRNVSSKYSQKLLGQAENPATYPLKTASKRVIQKTAQGTGNLIGNCF